MHGPTGDHVLIQDPFGNGLAELEHGPLTTRIRMADGSVAEDADPEALMLRLTGLPLPVRGIGDWLSGRLPPAETRDWVLDRDSLGRTSRLVRDGWSVRFEYAEALAEALPARIFASRQDALELRLSADRWTLEP
jgi:outer membrane biogenesis lipoprotein LolB